MRPLIPLTVGAEFSRLIQDCWHETPRLRPDFSAVLQRLEQVEEEVQAAAAAADGDGDGSTREAVRAVPRLIAGGAA